MIVQILTPAGWVLAEQLELFTDEHDDNSEQTSEYWIVNLEY